jgi:aspartyl-tRNA(Asn)/glutamyl-tRNA(Gln) amidotransferase subunit A
LLSKDELLDLDLERVAPMLRRREISPVELTEAALSRIEKFDPHLRCFITVSRELSIEVARAAEAEIMSGTYRGALHGIPLGLKDVIATRGVRTTNGSKIFAESVPSDDATVVERLKKAGAVIIGKNNLHEISMGSTTANPYFGTCRNPWNPLHVPGGSSGGSAAAVAAGLCLGAIGSDTAGSIRSPAAQCGVVGLKPTAGLVPRTGVFPVSTTFDHVGALARTVLDIALILQAIVGYDESDPASQHAPAADYVRDMAGSLNGLKVGVPTSYFFDGIDAEVQNCVRGAIQVVAELGATVVELAWPQAREAAEAVFTIMAVEAARYHRRWLDTRPADYSAEMQSRLQDGASIPQSAYQRAQEARQRLRNQFLTIMESVDIIAAPTNLVPAPRQGQTHVQINGKDVPVPAAMPLLGAPQNLTGCPALSLPCGFVNTGVPVGFQLIGRPFQEATLFRVARAYEQATDWHRRRPSMAALLAHA